MARMLDKDLIQLQDGPVVEVSTYAGNLTLYFDWGGHNQRWHLTPDEARQVHAAIGARLGLKS